MECESSSVARVRFERAGRRDDVRMVIELAEGKEENGTKARSSSRTFVVLRNRLNSISAP